MKKGFTLIEILAVMVIMAIIGAIAIPQMLKIIEESKVEIVSKNNNLLISTTKQYLMENRKEFPVEIGETKEITMEMLKENKNLNDIRNPLDKNETCNGYVLITKITDDNFDYTPHIKCGIDIKNSEEDRLLTHYKFVDFQEPTENLAKNYIQLMTGRTGYNVQVIPNQTFIEFGTTEAYKIVITGGDGVSTTPSARTIVPNTLNDGRTFTTSIKIKNTGTNDVGIANNIGSTIWVSPGEVKNVIQTGSGRGPGTSHYMYNIRVRQPNDNVEFLAYQLISEEKAYNTLYTDSFREGIVKDYSLNNNEFSLNLETTPKYTNQGYYFDNTYMQTNSYNQLGNADEFTYSFWMKAEEESGYILWKNNGILIDVGHASSSGAVRIRFNLDNDWRATYTYNYELNKWHHVVISWDNTNTKIYVDNELVVNSSADASFNNVTSSSDPIFIGQRSDVYYFKGYLNNIRIYGRALSENEIKDIYIIEQREL